MFYRWFLAPYNSFRILQCMFSSINSGKTVFCLFRCVLRKLQQVEQTDSTGYLFLRQGKRAPDRCMHGCCMPPDIQRCPHISGI